MDWSDGPIKELIGNREAFKILGKWPIKCSKNKFYVNKGLFFDVGQNWTLFLGPLAKYGRPGIFDSMETLESEILVKNGNFLVDMDVFLEQKICFEDHGEVYTGVTEWTQIGFIDQKIDFADRNWSKLFIPNIKDYRADQCNQLLYRLLADPEDLPSDEVYTT